MRLTDVIIGGADLVDVLQQFGEETMWVLGVGAIPPNPSELLGSPLKAKTVRDLEAGFDCVLLDAPPLIPVTDPAIVSTVAGGALVVVGSGIVHRERPR